MALMVAFVGAAAVLQLVSPLSTSWAAPSALRRHRNFADHRTLADVAELRPVPVLGETEVEEKPVGRFGALAARLLAVACTATLAALPRRRQNSAGQRPMLRVMAGSAASAPAAAKAFQKFSSSTIGLMLRLSTLNFCKIYMAMLVLRITIMWFPNINPYRQPFYSMIQLTDPYLNLFRGWMPPIFGIDLSVILAFVVIQAVIDTLTLSPY